MLVAPGGLMVSVLAVGPKVCGSNPAKGDKNPQRPFLRRGIKAFVPCRKILRHVNPTSMKEMFLGSIHFLRHILLLHC
jgi:hypothetical protein